MVVDPFFLSVWVHSEELERAQWGWEDVNMSVSTQLGLLLWKNFTYRRRQTVSRSASLYWLIKQWTGRLPSHCLFGYLFLSFFYIKKYIYIFHTFLSEQLCYFCLFYFIYDPQRKHKPLYLNFSFTSLSISIYCMCLLPGWIISWRCIVLLFEVSYANDAIKHIFWSLHKTRLKSKMAG